MAQARTEVTEGYELGRHHSLPMLGLWPSEE